MRKGDMRVIWGIVMLAVLLGLTIPSQAQSYTVWGQVFDEDGICLLYTSDAADE